MIKKIFILSLLMATSLNLLGMTGMGPIKLKQTKLHFDALLKAPITNNGVLSTAARELLEDQSIPATLEQLKISDPTAAKDYARRIEKRKKMILEAQEKMKDLKRERKISGQQVGIAKQELRTVQEEQAAALNRQEALEAELAEAPIYRGGASKAASEPEEEAEYQPGEREEYQSFESMGRQQRQQEREESHREERRQEREKRRALPQRRAQRPAASASGSESGEVSGQESDLGELEELVPLEEENEGLHVRSTRASDKSSQKTKYAGRNKRLRKRKSA